MKKLAIAMMLSVSALAALVTKFITKLKSSLKIRFMKIQYQEILD